ncbi:ATP-binding protein [Streptomyces sp. SID13666]|uniref:ATP-binding protein n=1 Tax=unclassified Streptomyces TaxID=2593676 RepID=UPI0013C13156|nr:MULTISPECIES: ATP-binding protein [unclassified Streptomyces]NEA58853.1 ATP-binding protein [Streptomyces sp. SID13666]NEA74517.1 ATP-binding protein [Streptomyces sp. SID13588]
MTSGGSNYRIVSPSLTVKAMRDSGYKNTAYALAELIDNSIDAHATLVEVFACECPVPGVSRTTHRVEKIAVLDNGDGMNADALRRALKFGDGRGDDRKRIGRFGMGLPNSSMSQCTKVEVWSWTNGPGNALYTYLDLAEIEVGRDDVPEPIHTPLPDYWRDLSDGLGNTGTLVLWTDLDRVNWHGAAATLRNTADNIGRVYRHYLNAGTVDIRMAPVRDGAVIAGTYNAAANDPLYLMGSASTPPPFRGEPMFEPFSMGSEDEPGVAYFPIVVDGTEHKIKVTASIARPEARRADVEGHPWPEDANPNVDAGSQAWGKHARHNIGISLIRQGRELDLDSSWAIGYDPVERWWGVEIDFPPALDAVFGVTNNKQTATIFSSLAHFDWRAEAEEDETPKAFKDRLAELGDPRTGLIDLALYFETKLLPAMRRKLKQQTVGNRKSRKRHDNDVTSKATDAVKRRSEDGHTGKTDNLAAGTSTEDRRQEQVDALTQRHHLDDDTAQSLVAESLENDWRVRWLSSYQDSHAFFSIDLMAGMLQVIFNEKHPLHTHLMTVLEEVPEDATVDDLRHRLERASDTFKLLLFSWARMEDEIPNDRQREKIADARQDWGRYARDFIDGENDE